VGGTNSSPTLRVHDQRKLNRDDVDEGFLIHSDYDDTDLETDPANAEWSAPINVRGWEQIELFVDYTKPAGGTLRIAVQVSGDKSTQDASWYDRTIEANVAGDNSIALGTPLEFDGATGRFMFKMWADGHYMRFKPYADTDGTDGRCVLRGVRRMLAM